MMRLLVALVGLMCAAGATFMACSVGADGPLDQMHWELYKKTFGKVYLDGSEEAMRKSLFLETKQRVEQHNARLADQLGFEMGYSHLSDWTTDELSNMMGSNTMEADVQRHKAREHNLPVDELPQFLRDISGANVEDLPKEVDWRKVENRVSSVKSQGICGSSYAFAAAGVLEGQQVNGTTGKIDKLIPLSVQNLIDCARMNNHCYDGFACLSFVDVANENGIMSEQDYPYIDRSTSRASTTKHRCRFDASKSVMNNIKGGYTMAPNEQELQKYVAKYGPVACRMYASPALSNYKSGVYTDPKCHKKQDQGRHTVLVVGYGTDPKQGDYWIVKNSWGTSWGEDGYLRLARNQDDMCGIANLASIAVLK